MTLVKGHRINGKVYDFPHLCPGESCAIAAWMYQRTGRLQQSEPITMAPLAVTGKGQA